MRLARTRESCWLCVLLDWQLRPLGWPAQTAVDQHLPSKQLGCSKFPSQKEVQHTTQSTQK